MLVVAILVGAGAGYLSGSGNVKTVTSVLTTSQSSTVTSFQSTTIVLTTTVHETTTETTAATPNLELIASVYPATITAGQNITVNWGVFNPLSTSVQVEVPVYKNPYLSPCPSYIDPTTFYVYKGHLSSSNLTGNTPLVLYNESIIIECFAGENSTVVFQPHSDRAAVSLFNSTTMAVMDTTANFRGYWTGTFASGYALNTFQPGRYTTMFNDTLGQQEFDYFTVNP